MDIAKMILEVAAVTQFIKNALAKLNINWKIQGAAAVVLSVLVSIGVVLTHWLQSGEPFNFALVITIIKVAIGANAGYSLLKVPRKTAKA
jgi:hypothetical protein